MARLLVGEPALYETRVRGSSCFSLGLLARARALECADMRAGRGPYPAMLRDMPFISVCVCVCVCVSADKQGDEMRGELARIKTSRAASHEWQTIHPQDRLECPRVARCFRLGWLLHLSPRGCCLRPASQHCWHLHPVLDVRILPSGYGSFKLTLRGFGCACACGYVCAPTSTYVPSSWHDRSSAYWLLSGCPFSIPSIWPSARIPPWIR